MTRSYHNLRLNNRKLHNGLTY